MSAWWAPSMRRCKEVNVCNLSRIVSGGDSKRLLWRQGYIIVVRTWWCDLFNLCQALQRAAKTDVCDKRWQKISDADKNNVVVAAVHFTATGILTLQVAMRSLCALPSHVCHRSVGLRNVAQAAVPKNVARPKASKDNSCVAHRLTASSRCGAIWCASANHWCRWDITFWKKSSKVKFIDPSGWSDRNKGVSLFLCWLLHPHSYTGWWFRTCF